MIIQFRDVLKPDQWADHTAHVVIHNGGDYWRQAGVAYVHTADGRTVWVTDPADVPSYLRRGVRRGDVTVNVIPAAPTPPEERPLLCVRCCDPIGGTGDLEWPPPAESVLCPSCLAAATDGRL